MLYNTYLETISNAFVQYYTNLFSTSGTGNISTSLSTMERKITPAMNNELLKEFTMEEVSVALNQMPPLKGPGPDGFSSCFYQKNWAIVGEQVSRVVLFSLNNGIINKDLNYKYIALIPKKKNPTNVTEF